MPASAGRPAAPVTLDASAPAAPVDAASPDAGPADASASDAAAPTCDRMGAAGADTPVIYIIGDSTASIYEPDLYPRTGWAQVMQDYFTPACAKVQDKALS